MRGSDERQAVLFSYRSIEDRIHPTTRSGRFAVDPVLVELSPRFDAVRVPTVCSKNRDRLLEGNIA